MKVGVKVVRNPATWSVNEFDSWGRGVGIGEVVEPPHELNDDQVDVRWPAGRCFELIHGLLEVKIEMDNDSVWRKTEKSDPDQCPEKERHPGAAAGEYSIYRCSKKRQHKEKCNFDDCIEMY